MPKYNKKMAYDKSGNSNNRYMGMLKGGSKGVMGHDGGVSSISTTSPQKRDMGKLQVRPMEYRGYADKAFEYKY